MFSKKTANNDEISTLNLTLCCTVKSKLEITWTLLKAPSCGLEFLNLKLGYSHSIYYKIPNTVSIKVLQSTKLFISGFDLNAVYKTAALVRGCKPPEPYKGKGILYSGEKVILKEGKKV